MGLKTLLGVKRLHITSGLRDQIYIVENKSGTEQVYDQTGRIEGFFLKSSHRQPDMMTEQSASKTAIRGRSMYNQTIQAYTPTNQNALAHSLTHSTPTALLARWQIRRSGVGVNVRSGQVSAILDFPPHLAGGGLPENAPSLLTTASGRIVGPPSSCGSFHMLIVDGCQRRGEKPTKVAIVFVPWCDCYYCCCYVL